jgi:hypothetical protein
MCARYWLDSRPALNIPTTLDYWNKYLEVMNATSPKGTSILRLISNLKVEQELTPPMSSVQEEQEEVELVADVMEAKKIPPLVIRPLNLDSIEYAHGFITHNPSLPLILVFDQTMSQNNQEGGGHAVVLHSLDTRVQKKIYVIDALRTQLGKPYPWDLDIFSSGWKVMRNLALAVYPYNEKVSINITSAKLRSSTLFDFMETGG